MNKRIILLSLLAQKHIFAIKDFQIKLNKFYGRNRRSCIKALKIRRL